MCLPGGRLVGEEPSAVFNAPSVCLDGKDERAVVCVCVLQRVSREKHILLTESVCECSTLTIGIKSGLVYSRG